MPIGFTIRQTADAALLKVQSGSHGVLEDFLVDRRLGGLPVVQLDYVEALRTNFCLSLLMRR